ncbi:hypothetical protein [Lacinutrix himadriensis]|uniref:hypothetical protein n=1 Tax=Lacinutrix himadriensis TaxID=641549 RepID=UPI0006E302D7|nr:hypothetical protein [Lacinutrix himadriensis]
MNNFFLLNEALNKTTVVEFEKGIKVLNDIHTNKLPERDNFIVNDNIWRFQTNNGVIYEFTYSIVSEEIRILIPKLFGAFKITTSYFATENILDLNYPNCCNGFLGINFQGLNITNANQINCISKFDSFINNCVCNQNFKTVLEFWDLRAGLFPNLVFCDRVLSQIEHLSINDDRLKLINNKLEVLNEFTGNWKEGLFNYKNLGLNNSPDTPTRVKKTLDLRTFSCPSIGDKVFSLHIKWSFGKEPFRLYYFPNDIDKKVYIGYIGPKDDIGF